MQVKVAAHSFASEIRSQSERRNRFSQSGQPTLFCPRPSREPILAARPPMATALVHARSRHTNRSEAPEKPGPSMDRCVKGLAYFVHKHGGAHSASTPPPPAPYSVPKEELRQSSQVLGAGTVTREGGMSLFQEFLEIGFLLARFTFPARYRAVQIRRLAPLAMGWSVIFQPGRGTQGFSTREE